VLALGRPTDGGEANDQPQSLNLPPPSDRMSQLRQEVALLKWKATVRKFPPLLQHAHTLVSPPKWKGFGLVEIS